MQNTFGVYAPNKKLSFWRKKIVQTFCYIDFLCIFAPLSFVGVLAHLARALDWQSKGGEFESRMLHSSNLSVFREVFLFAQQKKTQLYIKKRLPSQATASLNIMSIQLY